MQRFYATLALLCPVIFLFAQDLTFTSYDLDGVIDDPTLQEFADLPDGTAYMSYRYFAFGTRDAAMIRFDGNEWAPIDTLCTRCVRHITAGPDGELYVAAGDEGIYRRDGEAWTQVVMEAALDVDFSPAGLMHFINIGGVFTYDGSTVTPGNTTNLPGNLDVITEMEFRADGTLFFIRPATLYSYTEADGFTQRSEVTSPLHIAAHPDGKLYVADNFGQIGYFDAAGFTNNAIRGVFSNGIGLTDFDINNDGVFWGSQQGASPGVRRYNGTTASDVLSPESMIDEAILIKPLHAGLGGRVFVGADLRPGVAIINDETTATVSLSAGISSFGVQPNPAVTEVEVTGKLELGGLGDVRILDATGRTVSHRAVHFSGGRFTERFNLGGLVAGVYWVEVRVGTVRGATRLVVGK